MQQPNIAPGHVELWFTRIDRTNTPGLRERYHELLSDAERARAARLKLPRVRNEYLVTRALVREVLSRYADVPLRSWSFGQSSHGKPHVSMPWPDFSAFNLSHSAGMVVCAVTAEGQIGVDIESLQRKTSAINLARRFFSPAEVAQLSACPAGEQQAHFLQIWTLKEAFIKAIGHGLSFPLDKFSMSLPLHGPARIEFAPGQDFHPESTTHLWQFAQIRFQTNHHVSLAISFPELQELVVSARELVPLTGLEPSSENLTYETDRPLICQRANHWVAHQAQGILQCQLPVF